MQAFFSKSQDPPSIVIGSSISSNSFSVFGESPILEGWTRLGATEQQKSLFKWNIFLWWKIVGSILTECLCVAAKFIVWISVLWYYKCEDRLAKNWQDVGRVIKVLNVEKDNFYSITDSPYLEKKYYALVMSFFCSYIFILSTFTENVT